MGRRTPAGRAALPVLGGFLLFLLAVCGIVAPPTQRDGRAGGEGVGRGERRLLRRGRNL
jgi:hypothetical protein